MWHHKVVEADHKPDLPPVTNAASGQTPGAAPQGRDQPPQGAILLFHNPTTPSRFDPIVATRYALSVDQAPDQERADVPSVSDGRRRVCEAHLCAHPPGCGRVHRRTPGVPRPLSRL